MEVIDLGLNDTEPISLNIDDNLPSVNFGAGIELLMNDKMKSTNYGNSNIDLGELDKMEKDLNELGGNYAPEPEPSSQGTTKSFFGNWFGGNKSAPTNDVIQTDSNIGQATANTFTGFTKTSDGYGKLNTEVPIEAPSRMTDRERRRKKRLMLKKLDEWYEKGILKNNPGFNMDSNYEEIEDEYEGALEDKRRKDAIKVQGWWFMTLVNSIEYANAAFDPFGLNLDGWGEQVSEDLDSYEDIFVELYQKYKGGKLAPELALLLRLGFSAAVVNFTNKALSSATPGFNDVIRQSPELMKMFTNATVQSMSQASPGFNMANELLQPRQNREPDINMNFGPPPPAVATKNQQPPPRPGNNPGASSGMPMQFTRPDLMAARGVDMQQPTSVHMPMSRQEPPKRPEMRGPQNMDLNNILSNLKMKDEPTMEAALSGPPPQPQQPPMQMFPPAPQEQPIELDLQAEDLGSMGTSVMNENDSMLSLSSLREMQNANMPKRGRRRKTQQNQNTISLDI